MILPGLVLLFIVLYWLGGESWANTWFRDIGCSFCLLALAVVLFGFHWPLLAIVPICWGGMTIGDHGSWQWAIHAFVISLCMLPFALANGQVVDWGVMSFCVTLGTYLTSRFLSDRFMTDMWCRAALYASIPFWFLLK